MAGEPISTSNRGGWEWIPVVPISRPSRSLAESEKGPAYDAACARYYLGKQNHTQQWMRWFQANYSTNKAYAIDALWGEDADIRMFLGDGGSQTSRIPFKQPIVSPLLTRIVGGVDSIAINALAEPVTQQFAQIRREINMAKRAAFTAAASQSRELASALAPMGVASNEEESIEQFERTYQDMVIKGENTMMQTLAERYGINASKRKMAENIALSGMLATHYFVNGSNIERELCDPSEVGWEASAIRPDFMDSEAVWHAPLTSISALVERYPDKSKELFGLEKYANMAIANNTSINGGWPQSRPRTFTVYYKDARKIEFGFVNIDGDIEYVALTDVDGTVRYKDKDLVEAPPEFKKQWDTWSPKERRDKKQTRWVEVARYCTFIPWEYMPGSYTGTMAFSTSMNETAKTRDVGVLGDLVLDHGICELQEPSPDDEWSVRFPLKLTAWRYIGGHVVAPITAAIDPQRWMNQITSDLAWRMRKAGGKGVALEKSAVASGGMDEDEIILAMKEGDPITLDGSAFGGVNNAIREYDNSPGAGFYNMMGQLPVVKSIAESALGLDEANFGGNQGDQLVGTLQLQLQQAAVMQRPLYGAIVDHCRQEYQFIAQACKQFYAQRPWLLKRMTGDEGMAALIESKDMMLEQFRVKVDMVADNAQLRIMTDQQVIPSLMQMGMLDPVTAAGLMGRSIPQDAYEAARLYTKQAAAAQEAAAQQQAMAAEAAAVAQDAQMIEQDKAQLANEQTNAELKMAQVNQKLQQPEQQALSEWLKPPEQAIGQTAPLI
jgi:hypothetical protein